MTEIIKGVPTPIKITLRYESSGDEWPTKGYGGVPFLDTIAWFKKKMADIPKQYRASAKCEISSEGGWEGEHSAVITITYTRPESQEEADERINRALLRVGNRIHQRRTLYGHHDPATD